MYAGTAADAAPEGAGTTKPAGRRASYREAGSRSRPREKQTQCTRSHGGRSSPESNRNRLSPVDRFSRCHPALGYAPRPDGRQPRAHVRRPRTNRYAISTPSRRSPPAGGLRRPNQIITPATPTGGDRVAQYHSNAWRSLDSATTPRRRAGRSSGRGRTDAGTATTTSGRHEMSRPCSPLSTRTRPGSSGAEPRGAWPNDEARREAGFVW